MLTAKTKLTKDRDNWFSVFITSRSVKLTEQIVITWNGKGWQVGYELTQLKDDDLGTEKREIRRIDDKFPFINPKNQ